MALSPRPALAAIKPYEPGKPVEEVERELGIRNAIKLASNENPLGPSPLALAAMQQALEKASFYPDGACFNLRRALAAHLQVGEDYLIVGNGSDEILKLITEAFLQEGDAVLVCPPTFSEYEFAAQLMGGKCRYVPAVDFNYDLPGLKAAVGRQTKIIFLGNPNNPTGTMVTAADLEDLIQSLPDEVLLVLDEAYCEYVDSGAYPDSLAYVRDGKKNIIALRTFSKIYGLAGLRVGYGIADPALIASLHKVREPFNVNFLGQVAAAAAIGDTRHLEQSRQVNAEGKEFLYRELQSLGLRYLPTQANFVWMQAPRPCREVFKELLSRGIIVRTGDIFGYDDYLRVTIGTPEQNVRFVAALKEVLSAG
ncbi:MAG: histidinol-phosphate transaminase [Clostridia bacterium]|nr:MAG: histidinol-phosphate transaminase [Clostridia bacterium]